MTSLRFSLAAVCVAVLIAAALSYLVPTMHRPSSLVSASALFEAAYEGDLTEVRRLLAIRANHTQSQQQQQAVVLHTLRDSRNNTALHVRQTTQPLSTRHHRRRVRRPSRNDRAIECGIATRSACSSSVVPSRVCAVVSGQ